MSCGTCVVVPVSGAFHTRKQYILLQILLQNPNTATAFFKKNDSVSIGRLPALIVIHKDFKGNKKKKKKVFIW